MHTLLAFISSIMIRTRTAQGEELTYVTEQKSSTHVRAGERVHEPLGIDRKDVRYERIIRKLASACQWRIVLPRLSNRDWHTKRCEFRIDARFRCVVIVGIWL
jgi:hypothetical protein